MPNNEKLLTCLTSEAVTNEPTINNCIPHDEDCMPVNCNPDYGVCSPNEDNDGCSPRD